MRRLSQKENEGAVMQQELERITRVIGEGPYRDDWESLAGMEMPAWFGREVRDFYSLGALQHSGTQ